jgi:hypothetical protein
VGLGWWAKRANGRHRRNANLAHTLAAVLRLCFGELVCLLTSRTYTERLHMPYGNMSMGNPAVNELPVRCSGILVTSHRQCDELSQQKL